MTRQYIKGMPSERFAAKVDRDGPAPQDRPDLGPCHLWTGAVNAAGYGHFRVGDATVRAHRFAWEQEHGIIADGVDLDHLCRVRRCVRVGHLEQVTRAENLRRGREARRVGPTACLEEECDKIAHARGWCPMHYQRWRRWKAK